VYVNIPASGIVDLLTSMVPGQVPEDMEASYPLWSLLFRPLGASSWSGIEDRQVEMAKALGVLYQ